MRKAATSRGTTGLVLEGVRVARVALVKAVRSSSRAVSGTSASKRKTRRGGRVGGVVGCYASSAGQQSGFMFLMRPLGSASYKASVPRMFTK